MSTTEFRPGQKVLCRSTMRKSGEEFTKDGDCFWTKLLKMSGNPEEVDKKSVKAMKASLERLGGVSPEMRKRLMDKIEYKQAAWALQ